LAPSPELPRDKIAASTKKPYRNKTNYEVMKKAFEEYNMQQSKPKRLLVVTKQVEHWPNNISTTYKSIKLSSGTYMHSKVAAIAETLVP
jgi:hypothetical protein